MLKLCPDRSMKNVVYHLQRIFGNFGTEFSFGKNVFHLKFSPKNWPIVLRWRNIKEVIINQQWLTLEKSENDGERGTWLEKFRLTVSRQDIFDSWNAQKCVPLFPLWFLQTSASNIYLFHRSSRVVKSVACQWWGPGRANGWGHCRQAWGVIKTNLW